VTQVTRSTRKIALGLLGSAALFGCCFTSCIDVREEPERDANGNIVRHHRRYSYRPWFSSRAHAGIPLWAAFGSSSGSSYSRGGGYHHSSGGRGSKSSSGVTSRGGFGGGHSASGS